MSGPTAPDFAIARLGEAKYPSPLRSRIQGPVCRFFVSDDERVLYDIIGTAWQFTALPEHIEPRNLELALSLIHI